MSLWEAFEHWYSYGAVSPKSVERTSGGEYRLMGAAISWKAWKASALAEREACAKVCDEIANATEPDDFALDAVNAAAAQIRGRSN